MFDMICKATDASASDVPDFPQLIESKGSNIKQYG
jgi:hypothetical protein